MVDDCMQFGHSQHDGPDMLDHLQRLYNTGHYMIHGTNHLYINKVLYNCIVIAILC